jgi:hypothetical protein
MDAPNPANMPAMGSRRNEDIALDLLRFVAGHTEFVKSSGVGFTNSADKAKDQADKLLELYGRCLEAVEGKRK